MKTTLVGLGLLFALAGCAGPGGLCSAGEISGALRDAAAGTTVQIGQCRVEGSFSVPAGVTLRGHGAASVVASSAIAIELAGDGARVESLRVEQGGGHGIAAFSAGAVTIEDVEVEAGLGRSAIGIQGPSVATIRRVALRGPVTEANQNAVASPPTELGTVLFGLALIGVTDAQLEDVVVSGFGRTGVVSSETTLEWRGGEVRGNLGVGVWIDAGRATIEDVTIADTLRGFQGAPTWGLIARRGARLETRRVMVNRSHDGFGVAQDSGDAVHTGLVAEGHEYGAVFAQRTSSFVLTGASAVRNNDFAGMLAVEAGGLVVEDSSMTSTRTAPVPFGDWGTVTVGDGIQIIAPTPGTIVRDVVLGANERAGLLVDLDASDTSSLALSGVSVSAEGAGVGCVTQNGTQIAGWDAAVTRAGTAIVNDPAFAGGLDIVGLIGPIEMPASDDLSGLIGPIE